MTKEDGWKELFFDKKIRRDDLSEEPLLWDKDSILQEITEQKIILSKMYAKMNALSVNESIPRRRLKEWIKNAESRISGLEDDFKGKDTW